MNIQIRNTAKVPNKYIRFFKWRLFTIKRKFNHLKYVEVFIKKEGKAPVEYKINLRLGVSGHDIILKKKSPDLNWLLNRLGQDVHRQLAQYSE